MSVYLFIFQIRLPCLWRPSLMWHCLMLSHNFNSLSTQAPIVLFDWLHCSPAIFSHKLKCHIKNGPWEFVFWIKLLKGPIVDCCNVGTTYTPGPDVRKPVLWSPPPIGETLGVAVQVECIVTSAEKGVKKANA